VQEALIGEEAIEAVDALGGMHPERLRVRQRRRDEVLGCVVPRRVLHG